MIDKMRCWRALALCMSYNEQSDFYYRHVYGDKETSHLAFRKITKSHAMRSQRNCQGRGHLLSTSLFWPKSLATSQWRQVEPVR